MKSYSQFWNELKNAYPISRGELKLPIASQLINFDSVDIEALVEDSKSFLQMTIDSVLSDKMLSEKYFGPDGVLANDITGIVRLDGILQKNGEYKIIEINADYPDGLLLHDETYSTLSNTPVKTHQINLYNLIKTEERILIIYANQFFKDAYFKIYEELKSTGAIVDICTLEEVTFRDGLAWKGANWFNVIKRCAEKKKFEPELREKMHASDCKIINTTTLRNLGIKSLLKDIDHKLLPKTQMLTDTTIDIAINNKDKYIIKPTNMYEGIDVYLGIEYEQDEREHILSQYVNKEFVLQEYVHMEKISIDMYIDDDIHPKQLYFDLCPHFFVEAGKVTGVGHILMRFSENRVLNVAQGGGIGYYNFQHKKNS